MPITAPYPGPLSVLIMDNAPIHRGDQILELADRFGKFYQLYHWVYQLFISTGVRIEYLPPYSPDLNPIEEAFSKIKAFIRRNNDVFLSAPSEAIRYDMFIAMDVITESDAISYFIHAGYF